MKHESGDKSGSTQAALLSPFLMEGEEQIEILPPQLQDDRLLFQAFCNGMPIGFARLRRLRPEEEYAHPVVQLNAAVRFPTWSLQSIQVAQNFRNRGIGTALLREILHYCRHNHIQRLIGEMKGELPALQRWYTRHGFRVSADNRIELLVR